MYKLDLRTEWPERMLSIFSRGQSAIGKQRDCEGSGPTSSRDLDKETLELENTDKTFKHRSNLELVVFIHRFA